MIGRISNRLYENATSPVPSDLGLFKAANERKVQNRKLNLDLNQRVMKNTSRSSAIVNSKRTFQSQDQKLSNRSGLDRPKSQQIIYHAPASGQATERADDVYGAKDNTQRGSTAKSHSRSRSQFSSHRSLTDNNSKPTAAQTISRPTSAYQIIGGTSRPQPQPHTRRDLSDSGSRNGMQGVSQTHFKQKLRQTLGPRSHTRNQTANENVYANNFGRSDSNQDVKDALLEAVSTKEARKSSND